MRICDSEWSKCVWCSSAFVRLPARKITDAHAPLQVLSRLSVHVCSLCIFVRTRARVRMRICGSEWSRRVCLFACVRLLAWMSRVCMRICGSKLRASVCAVAPDAPRARTNRACVCAFPFPSMSAFAHLFVRRARACMRICGFRAVRCDACTRSWRTP